MVENNVPTPGDVPQEAATGTQRPAPQTPPQSAPQPPQQQYAPYQQVPMYPAPPRGSPFENLVKPSTLAMLTFIGMVLVLLGAILNSSVMFMTDSDNDTIMHTIGAGYMLLNMGMFISSTFLILAGMLQKGTDRNTRIALLMAGTLLLMAWLRAGFNPIMGLLGWM